MKSGVKPIDHYNIAIAGYGAFGRFLKRSWERLPNVRVAAITRTTDERARSSALADGIPKYSSRYEDLLNDPEIDIVSIATPPYLHAEQAVAALEAGKHILIEKPLATNLQDGERVLQAVSRSGKRAAVNFIMRYNPVIERVKRVVQGGFLGGLYRVLQENYASSQGLSADHWFWDINKSGGIFIEHGVHFFDLVNWMADAEPVDVHGFLTGTASGMEDKVMANVEYENGLLATVYNSFSRPAAIEKTWGEYVFDRGEIVTEGWIPLKLRLRGFVTEQELFDLTNVLDGGTFSVEPMEEKDLESSSGRWRVDYKVSAAFEIERDKEEVYAESASGLLADMIHWLEDPSHRMRVTVEDALASLRTACAASSYRR